MATTILSQGPPRRRPLTYGKKTSRLPSQHSFTPEAPEVGLLGHLTPTKTPSKLRKLGHDPVKSSSLRQRACAAGEHPTVFDVLSSEEDSPASPTPRAIRSFDKRLNCSTKASTPDSTCHQSRTSSSDFGKRKRSDSRGDLSRQSSSSVATNDQIADQLFREWAAADARPSSTPNDGVRQQTEENMDIDVLPAVELGLAPNRTFRHRKDRNVQNGRCQGSQSKISRLRATKVEKNTNKVRSSPDHVSRVKDLPRTPPRCLPTEDSTILPHTPPDSGSSPDCPQSGTKAITTPRQARLWDTLLEGGQKSIPTKGMNELKLRTTPSAPHEGVRSPPRLRLIDSLMAGAESTPTEADSEEDQTRVETEPRSESSVTQIMEIPSESQPVPVPTLGPKITYAQQRSYLSTNTEHVESLLDQSLDLGLSPAVAVSTNSGPKFQGPVDKAEDEEDEGNGQMRSIHELRASGNNRRFDCETEKLLEDISDSKKSALSSKRSALLELVQKFTQTAFKNRFLQSPFANQIFEVCNSESDPITGTAIAAAIAFVQQSNEGQPLMPLVRAKMARRSLQNMLHLARDIRAIARDRHTNMSKVAQGAVAELESMIKTSPIWADTKPKLVTPRLVALKALDLLVRRHREAGKTESLIDEQAVRVLLDIMAQSGESLKKNVKASREDCWLQLELSTSILESCSIAPALPAGSTLWNEEVLAQSVDCMGTALALTQPQIQTIRPLLLRLSLNLANSNEHNSDCFAKPSYVCKVVSLVTIGFKLLESEAVDEQQQQQDIDQLLLALGSLFNLTEMSERTRQLVVDECGGDLGEMVHIFANSRGKYAEADSMAGSQMNVALGYLAVLLANLCRNEEAKTRIQANLPGCRLTTLVEAIDEFITFHKVVDMREAAGDVWTSFTTRLQGVAEVLKALEAQEQR